MPAFEYEALDVSGRSKRGVISADSARQARFELRNRSLTPVSVSVPKDNASAKAFSKRPHKVSPNELVIFTRQLAVLVGASTPLEEALNAVALQTPKEGSRKIILAVRERVMEGWRFAEAMKEYKSSFPELYRAVVAAGETSGDMGGVLDRLANMLEKNRKMKNAAMTAMIYPIVLALVAGGVIVGLLTQVVPKIVDNFNSFDADLPWITKVVVGISEFLQSYGLIIFSMTVLFGLCYWWSMKNPQFRLWVDKSVLSIPLIGNLIKGHEGARFARTLSTLFSGGAPLLDSLIGAQRTVSNVYIRTKLNQSLKMVREGGGLAKSLKRPDVLPPMMVHMLAAGERAGDVPIMLDKAAEQLEEEFETSSTIALRLIEPAIIVAMGGIVLIIVLSILLPILRLNSLASG